MGQSITYYINLGAGIANIGAIKYAFYTQDENYKGIERQLGVIKARQNARGLIFGANAPKPARVRINFEGGGSTTRFCDPGKMESVTVGGVLNRRSVDFPGIFNRRKISTVTAVRG